jgi:hypothetical protein
LDAGKIQDLHSVFESMVEEILHEHGLKCFKRAGDARMYNYLYEELSKFKKRKQLLNTLDIE